MLIPFFIIVPLVVFVACCLLPNPQESVISRVAVSSIVVVLAMFVWMLIPWAQGGFVPLSQTGLTLFYSSSYVFALNFYMDITSVVFFLMTCLTSILVLIFSKYYMHRDPGFRRFHATILFFFVGLATIIFSGNFETLFVGWEFIGISSFLLISFYRERFLPTRNGLKVFSIYRIADALFVVALWYAHHIFEHNIQFAEFTSLVRAHGNSIVVLGGLLLIVALIKSAQFPFSYWLPRAMEGPTTSSAIFYGALSVHIGLFLLLRTFPLWEGSLGLRVAIVALGAISAVIASSIARVQSSIKTQIAYASITQIGIMFIELALGLHSLVLFHFISNACLRTYQLLISPSILSYLIHYQFYTFEPPENKIHPNFAGKLRSTLYILGVKEWSMDSTMTQLLWQPLKRMGRWLRFLDKPLSSFIYLVLLVVEVYFAYAKDLYHGSTGVLIWVSGILSLLLFVRAYASKRKAITCWTQIFVGQLFGSLFLGVLSGATWPTLIVYLSGILVAYLVGVACLTLTAHKMGEYRLIEFHGQMHESPVIGNVFFLSCLAMMVFPITPSFLGEELLLSSISTSHFVLMIVFALGYVLCGISVMRLFAKVFFGPHEKTYQEVAYRSS